MLRSQALNGGEIDKERKKALLLIWYLEYISLETDLRTALATQMQAPKQS